MNSQPMLCKYAYGGFVFTPSEYKGDMKIVLVLLSLAHLCFILFAR